MSLLVCEQNDENGCSVRGADGWRKTKCSDARETVLPVYLLCEYPQTCAIAAIKPFIYAKYSSVFVRHRLQLGHNLTIRYIQFYVKLLFHRLHVISALQKSQKL